METTTIELEPTECALVTSDDMEGLHFTFPNPEYQDLENSGIPVPQLMGYLAACYYRYFRDPEFVRQQMDWCKANLQNTLGRDMRVVLHHLTACRLTMYRPKTTTESTESISA